MRRVTILAMLLAVVSMSGYGQKGKKEVNVWFEAQQWQLGAKGEPSAAIDRAEFADHYKRFPLRWKTVFEFIKNNDLKALPLGQSRLSDDVTVNVQQYNTRLMDKPETYEQHAKMIDVQYVVTGRELHGTVKKNKAQLAITYNEKRDIAMYSAQKVPYQIIGEGEYSIFFPDDVHLTNIGYGSQTPIRKVVFKVKAE